VYTVADDLAQAVNDLQADWGVERHQRWITDTGARVGRHPEPALALVTSAPPETPVPLEMRRAEACQRLAALERDLTDLHAGTGRWHHTPQGDAAQQRNDAAKRLDEARRRANAPTTRRRDRRAAARSLDGLTAALDAAERHWQQVGQPLVDRLHGDITRTRTELDRIDLEALRRRLDRSPDLAQGRDLGRGVGL
jgi:hypothetical protein